jgi:hypothetical protein
MSSQMNKCGSASRSGDGLQIESYEEQVWALDLYPKHTAGGPVFPESPVSRLLQQPIGVGKLFLFPYRKHAAASGIPTECCK